MSDLIKHPLLEKYIDLNTVNAIFPDTDANGQPRVVFLLLKKRPKKEIQWEFDNEEIRNHFLIQIQK
ncbi:hypothetical protein [Telluribacter sp.]|jgi:hypothetical protein|uniref:hypothetical protein n=1 Tax=Telluribacter sp. TaxID=1978767 RepID=UPI002E15BABB